MNHVDILKEASGRSDGKPKGSWEGASMCPQNSEGPGGWRSVRGDSSRNQMLRVGSVLGRPVTWGLVAP